MAPSLPPVRGSYARVPEVHELPDRLVRELLDERARAEVLHPALAAEAQVGAVEAGQRRREPLDAVDAVDQPVAREDVLDRVGQHVAVVPVLVAVAQHVRHRLAGLLVGVDVLEREGDLLGVAREDVSVLGEHEVRDRRVAVLLVRGHVRRDHGVRARLTARPVPVVDELLQGGVAPVVVVVADAGGLVDLLADAVAHLDRPLRDRRQPGELMRLVGAEVDVAGSRPPRRDLAGERHVDAHLVDRGERGPA